MPENAVQAIQLEKSFPNSHSVAVTAGTLDRTETVFHNHGISGVPIFARSGVDRWVPHPMGPEGGFIYQAGPDLPREFTNRVIHQVVNGLRVRNLNAELLIDNDGQPIGIGIDSGSANPARLELPHPGPLITIRHSDRDDVNEALKKTMWDMRDELERMRLSFKPNDTHCEVLPSKGRVVGGQLRCGQYSTARYAGDGGPDVAAALELLRWQEESPLTRKAFIEAVYQGKDSHFERTPVELLDVCTVAFMTQPEWAAWRLGTVRLAFELRNQFSPLRAANGRSIPTISPSSLSPSFHGQRGIEF